MSDKNFEEWMESSSRIYDKIIPNFISQQEEIIRRRDEVYPRYTISALMEENKKYLSDCN